MKISLDFNSAAGKIKPLHGVNNAPFSHLAKTTVQKFMADGGIPYSRLHDTMGIYGGSHFVDIPNIFPDFNADVEDEKNFDFTLTDEFIRRVCEAGTKIVYRLGVTIDWGIKKYHIFPPKDNLKWAKICEKIIMHYNYGWANGFHYDIKDWEIWNEPENPPMWQGTKEQYFELYVTASKYLKEKFPEIKIGGYGSCGFYALTRENMGDFYEGFVTYFYDFLKRVKSENAPLDFYSWHIYTADVCELAAHAEFVRKTLDEHGFGKTEISLNEWNYGDEGKSHALKRTMDGASFVMASLCALQKGPVDTAMYYQASMFSSYNGLYDAVEGKYLKPFYALQAFNSLFVLGDYVPCKADKSKNVFICAARCENKGAVIIANTGKKDTVIELCMKKPIGKKEMKVELSILDSENDFDVYRKEIYRGDVAIPVINLGGKSVVKADISWE